MNKYTLNFVDKALEAQYQKETIENIRKIIFYLLTTFLIIQSIVILSLSKGIDALFLTYGSAILACSSLSIILGYFRIVRMQLLLIICNFCFMFIQINTNVTNNKQAIYNSGSNMMMIHCVIISVSDFPESVFQIVVIYFFKMFMLSYFEHFVLEQSISTGMLVGIFIFNTYRQVKANRLQFLLRFSSIKWGTFCFLFFLDQLLSKVIEKRFVYFKYDQYKMQFKLLQSNTYKNNEAFLEFMRIHKVEDKSLENYLFYNIKRCSSDVTQQDLILKDLKQTFAIQLNEFYLEDPSFIIILDQEKQKSEQYFKNVESIKQKYTNTILKVIKFNLKYTHQSIEKKNIKLLFKLRFILFSYLIRKSQQKLRTIQIYSSILFITKILKMKRLNCEITCKDQNLTIQTIENLFFELILYLINNFHKLRLQITIDQIQYKDRLILMSIRGKIKKINLNLQKYDQILQFHKQYTFNNLDIIDIYLKEDFSFQQDVNKMIQ